MRLPPGLDAFLQGLRAEGIPIGPIELRRLRHALALQPKIDAGQLRQLLRCTLVKSDQQREVFEPLFEQWLRLAEETPSDELPGASSGVADHGRRPKLSQKETEVECVLLLRAAALLALLAMAAWLPIWTMDIPARLSQEGLDEHGPSLRPSVEEEPSPTIVAEPQSDFWAWEACALKVEGHQNRSPSGALAGWGLLCLGPWLAGALLLLRHRLVNRLPAPPATVLEGPKWLPLLLSASKPTELLDEEDRQNLVWGVARFVSEDLSRRIDLDATVRETARSAGIPKICREPSVYPREVWLWQDGLARDAVIDEAAAEIERGLRQAGLPVRRGCFHDLPDRVRWSEGEEFAPLAVEGHRQSAIVCIFCNGSGLKLAYEADNRRGKVAQLLRGLSQWPRLAFIDTGEGREGMGQLLRPFGLACIDPSALADFLAAHEPIPGSSWVRRPGAVVSGDLRAWAAALALAPEPVSNQIAQELRQTLGFDLPAMDLREIEAHLGAERHGDRLSWRPEGKAKLLNWLSAMHVASGRRSSLLVSVVGFWLDRCREEAHERRRRQQREESLHLWDDTLAERHNELRQALLRLWIEPERSAKELYRLYQVEELLSPIKRQLRLFAPADFANSKGGPAVLTLPWEWGELTPRAKRMFWEMELAARPTSVLRPSPAKVHGGLSLAAGLCFGLGIASSASALDRTFLAPSQLPKVHFASHFDQEFFRKHLISVTETGPGTGYRIKAGDPRSLGEVQWCDGIAPDGPVGVIEAPSASSVTLQWKWKKAPYGLEAQEKPGGESEIWRAGSLPQPIRASEEGWPRRSLMVLGYPLASKPARRLAIQLLDQGSVDAVLIGSGWQEHLDRFLVLDRAQCAQDQLAIVAERIDPRELGDLQPFAGHSAVQVAEESIPELLANLESMSPKTEERSDGKHRIWLRPLEQVWHSDVAEPISSGRQAFSLRSRPEEWEDARTGLTFIKVGGGTFRMGTDEDYQNKAQLRIFEDEMPAHAVSVSGFWMAKDEVDERTYRKWEPDHRSAASGDVAVTEVRWNDARGFCEAYGHRLPSEAEWEFAARAGSATLFHFGDDPDRLGSFAWYGPNANRPQPVGRKQPNPLGLHDMHGNVWEWVQDAWNREIYKARFDSGIPVIDPVEQEGSAEGRVVRGGSWGDEPEVLRSAYRRVDWPSYRVVIIGFRCASSPRRQP